MVKQSVFVTVLFTSDSNNEREDLEDTETIDKAIGPAVPAIPGSKAGLAILSRPRD